MPPVHGVGNGLIDETLRFRRKSWQELFQRNELEIIGTAKGPISTGHGFGFKGLKTLLEKLGVSSEYVFLCGAECRLNAVLRQAFFEEFFWSFLRSVDANRRAHTNNSLPDEVPWSGGIRQVCLCLAVAHFIDAIVAYGLTIGDTGCCRKFKTLQLSQLYWTVFTRLLMFT